ncbi:MAG: hypothetical protein GIX02_08620, partial [Candidatus Eremiobacteraeota bacterium]|nr:hypothetical protein [Candidatus Eremiobacteraeota bacterium]
MRSARRSLARLGIHAALFVACCLILSSTALVRERSYFIAADEIVWNYLPSGHNALAFATAGGASRQYLGFSFRKAVGMLFTIN